MTVFNNKLLESAQYRKQWCKHLYGVHINGDMGIRLRKSGYQLAQLWGVNLSIPISSGYLFLTYALIKSSGMWRYRE